MCDDLRSSGLLLRYTDTSRMKVGRVVDRNDLCVLLHLRERLLELFLSQYSDVTVGVTSIGWSRGSAGLLLLRIINLLDRAEDQLLHHCCSTIFCLIYC